jgi:cell division protein FtsQ
MDKETKMSPAKKHFLLMALLALMLVGMAVYANLWKENRRVEEVVVEGNRVIPSREILALAKVPANALLFELDLFEIERRVQKNEFVKSAAVHRDLPNRVRITVEERTPVAAVVMNGRPYYLDADGVVLPPARSPFIFDLAVLTGALPTAELLVGRQTKNRTVLDALHVLAVARAIDEHLHANISEVKLNGGAGMMLYTSDAAVPVILGRTNIGAQLVKLAAFWKEVVARQGAENMQYIDLRFEEQVVVRQVVAR